MYLYFLGVQHWHCLAKLPNVLDTALLGRMIQNMRVVRQELKCGNIKPDKKEKAWEIIEMGLLAHRYVVMFADSISTASFYSKKMAGDEHDAESVLDLEDLRKEFVDNYMKGNINLKTHPIMRQYFDPECDSNLNIELAKVAAVSCIHQCMPNSCGGDESGKGCRFDFPKKNLPCTNVAIMQVNCSLDCELCCIYN